MPKFEKKSSKIYQLKPTDNQSIALPYNADELMAKSNQTKYKK